MQLKIILRIPASRYHGLSHYQMALPGETAIKPAQIIANTTVFKVLESEQKQTDSGRKFVLIQRRKLGSYVSFHVAASQTGAKHSPVVYCRGMRGSHGKTLHFSGLGNPGSKAGKARVLKRVEESQKGSQGGIPKLCLSTSLRNP